MKGAFHPILFLALLLLISVSSGRELIEDRNENNPKHDQWGPIVRGIGHVAPHVIPHFLPHHRPSPHFPPPTSHFPPHHPPSHHFPRHPPTSKDGYSAPAEHAEFVKAHGVPRN